MVMRPPMPSVQLSRRGKIALAVIAALLILLILAASLVNVYTDWLWFGEVGFRGVYSTILRTRLILFFAVGIFIAGIIGGNIVLAYRLRPPFRPMSPEQQNLERYRIAIEPRKKLAFISLMILIGLIAGSSAQRQWKTWLLWFNGGHFGQADPQFHRDLSFWMWDYPMYRTMLGIGYSVVIFSILASAVVYYLYGALRVQTPGPKITIAARRHLTVLVFFFITLKAMSYWLDRYGLVFSSGDKVNGASYTDVNARLPAKTILFWVAVIIAILVLASIWLSSPTLPAISFGVLLVMSVVIGGIYPALVQQISVKPNASVKEAKYISRNIESTRQAYGISTVTTSDGTSTGDVSYQDYAGSPDIATSALTSANYPATVDNLRLADPNVVSPAFTTFQRIQNFYGFPDKLDVDRYQNTDGTDADYVVGVRELKQSNLTGTQTNWINQHSVYTHGYGFVAAPADSAVNGKGDFSEGSIPVQGNLTITQPRVYYGELGVDYSIVGSDAGKAEYDGDGQTTTYTGSGGVKLGNIFTRAAFAVKYGQFNFLLNNTVSSKGAKIIFDRNPRQRVLKVAPYLKVDGDPYPAVVNGRIVWILDGYTTASNYPYSEKEQLGNLTQDSLTAAGRTTAQSDTTFNYIRNSVKATVDAYDGTVHLYQWDDTDPVLKAWMKIFPGTVEKKSAIPTQVLDHIRYPQDLFEVQRALLAKYHVTDPVQFYNVRDQWSVPSDPNQANLGDQPPYYLLTADPDNPSKAGYQLTTPMLVNNSPNMAAYITVNSDATSPNYGKMTVLKLASSNSILGPGQVTSQFRSNATQFRVQGNSSTVTINQEITLFDQGGSKVVWGNLLTLPVAKGFLYVQPMYVQASGSPQPLLRRVIVYFGDSIGYDATLSGALTNLTLQSSPGTTTPTPSGSATTTPSTPTTSGSSTATPTPGPVSTGNAQIDSVLKQLDAAAVALTNAYKTGNLAAIGQAQADLKRLAEQYAQLRTKQSASPSPTPSGTR